MKITIISFLIVFAISLSVFEAVRRKVLETKYSILWLSTCFVLAMFSLNNYLLEYIANLFDIHYAPSVLFLFGFLFLLIIVFDLTRRLSKMNNQIYMLTQEHAILKQKYEKKEKNI